MFPIIYDIAIKNNIRPERPMAASSIASQMGIVASPVSVAVVSFVTLLAGYKIGDYNITYTGFLAVTIPSTFFGVLCVGLFSWFRGKDLEKDRSFQEFISNKDNKHYVYGSNETLIGKKLPYASRLSMYIFLSAIIIVAALGAIPALRPIIGGKALNMVLTIQLFMLLAGAIIIIFTKTKANEISKNEIFRSGMIAIVAVYGIAWMADTMFQANLPELKNILSEVVKQHPWSYALALFLVSKFVNSQAAAINALVPTALLIGVEPLYVVAFAAACYGYYILPTYPSDLAAIQFDRSGTTKIGKYVINHSFILPGLIGVIASCLMGLIIVKIVILL
jgi:anaerobic C4-dicarboxylate transporter DcuB